MITACSCPLLRCGEAARGERVRPESNGRVSFVSMNALLRRMSRKGKKRSRIVDGYEPKRYVWFLLVLLLAAAAVCVTVFSSAMMFLLLLLLCVALLTGIIAAACCCYSAVANVAAAEL